MWDELTSLVTSEDLKSLDKRLIQSGAYKKHPDIKAYSLVGNLCRMSLYQLLHLENFKNYVKIKKMLHQSRQSQLSVISQLLPDLFNFLNLRDNTIFHIIGDHHVGCGELYDFIGNAAYINIQDYPEVGKTIWLTNQVLDKTKIYYTYDFDKIILEVLK